MLSRLIIILILVCSSFVLGMAQRSASLPPNAEAGKCYAKCLIAPNKSIEGFEEVSYPIYVGTDPDVKTRDIEIIIQPPSTEWEKKKADRNCLSADPNDCLVWCLVEIPGIYETITIPRKLKNIPEKDIVYESYEVAIVPDNYNNPQTEWREVLCGNQVKEHIIRQIRQSLIRLGFDILKSKRNIMDQEVKDALVSYQKNNGLPIGALDFETLKSLDINY